MPLPQIKLSCQGSPRQSVNQTGHSRGPCTGVWVVLPICGADTIDDTGFRQRALR